MASTSNAIDAQPPLNPPQPDSLQRTSLEMRSLEAAKESGGVDDGDRSITSEPHNNTTSALVASESTASSSAPINAQHAPSASFNPPTSDAATKEASPPFLPRQESTALEPANDSGLPSVSLSSSGPVCIITLLLTSGARHPYKIDEKYLNKRNVAVPGTDEQGRKDPFSISVYTLKELILREWREEWEGKPSSPSSIRLIHFGRLLDDKIPLKDCRFNHDSPNVVHMTVRPQEVVDEEDASKSKAMSRNGDSSEVTHGCRCIMM